MSLISRFTQGWTVRKECRVLTLRSRVVLGLGALALIGLSARLIYPFLAITAPVESTVLVLDGWIPERAYATAADIYFGAGYSQLLIVVPIYEGDQIFGGPDLTLEEYLKQVATQNGIPAAAIRIVFSPSTHRNRTYQAALAVRDWLKENRQCEKALNIATMGPHARRSRLLYRRAFGSGVSVGVYAMPDVTYQPRRWWRYSAGIREVFSEMLAYGYAKLFFRHELPLDRDLALRQAGKA